MIKALSIYSPFIKVPIWRTAFIICIHNVDSLSASCQIPTIHILDYRATLRIWLVKQNTYIYIYGWCITILCCLLISTLIFIKWTLSWLYLLNITFVRKSHETSWRNGINDVNQFDCGNRLAVYFITLHFGSLLSKVAT